MEKEQNFKWHPRMKAANKDIAKWCVFHKNTKHETRDCKHLKKEIEELLLKGYFGELVDIENHINNVRPITETSQTSATPDGRWIVRLDENFQ